MLRSRFSRPPGCDAADLIIFWAKAGECRFGADEAAWFNERRHLERPGNIGLAEAEERYCPMAGEPAMAEWLKRNGLGKSRGDSSEETGAVQSVV